MYASGTIIELLPDWYLIERETEKTINKLNSLRELDYYIYSTDEYLRRLALLRLKKLGLMESGSLLKEIMDDPVETHANKFIAAWALKSLLVGSDSDYIINSRYLASFTGHEKYEDLFSVLLQQEIGSVRFQFSSSPYFTAFKINDEDSVLEKDIFFETKFDYKQWLNDLRSSLKTNTAKFLPFIIKLLKKAAGYLSKKHDKKNDKAPKKHIKTVSKHIANDCNNKSLTQPDTDKAEWHTDVINRSEGKRHSRNGNDIAERLYGKAERPRSKDYLNIYDRMRTDLYCRPGFFDCVKKGVFQLFYLLFYPFRFARKHKFAFLCTILLLYAFFAYFSYGRAITNKYAGFDLQEVQSQLFKKAGNLYYQALNEINRITGIDEWKENSASKQSSNDILKTADITTPKVHGSSDETELFTVIAKDGLNIRTEPDPASQKVGSTALQYGTSVTFISSAYSESAGIEWFYVKAEDGRIGWVSSKYLKKAGDK